jgi:O-antigen/teichoic acid export membrane protein
MPSTIIYFLSFGLSGVLQLATLKIITLLFGAEEFGVYTILFALSGFIQVFAFQWLRVMVLRFEGGTHHLSQTFYPILKILLWLGVLCAWVTGLVIEELNTNLNNSLHIIAGACLLGLNEISIARYRAHGKATQFLLFSNIRYAAFLACTLIFTPSTASELFTLYIISLAIGCSLSPDSLRLLYPSILELKKIRKPNLIESLRFGAPLIISLSLTAGFIHIVKLMISTELPQNELGSFSVRLDYCMYFIAMLFMVCNIIAFNKLKNAFDSNTNYQELSAKVLSFILQLGLFASLVFITKTELIDELLLSNSYKNQDQMWQAVAISVLLFSVRIYLLDVHLYITQRTTALTVQAGVNLAIFVLLFLGIHHLHPQYIIYCFPLSQLIACFIAGIYLKHLGITFARIELFYASINTFIVAATLVLIDTNLITTIILLSIISITLFALNQRDNIKAFLGAESAH